MMIAYGSATNFVVSYDSSFTGGTQPNGPALAEVYGDRADHLGPTAATTRRVTALSGFAHELEARHQP
jgi:hypothetical protein